MVFTLTQDIKNIAQAAIDDLINQLGKTCRLYYPPNKVACANCKLDPRGNKSSNIWINGGPIPFNNTVCPMCEGKFFTFQEVTEVITLLCTWNTQPYLQMQPHIQVPDGVLMTKGFIEDMPKVMRCQYMMVETAIEPMVHYRYKLAGEPIDPGNIVQGQFFQAMWKRYS